MFPYPARWRGGEGKLELHPLGIPFAPSADGAALRWRIGCLRTDVADGFQESAGRTIHSGHQRRGKSGSGLRHAAVWRQHHGRGVQSVRLLLRTAWRIYRSHADYGTYPFLFHADKEQCHAADNGYHDRLHRFFGHCPAELLCYGRGGAVLYDMGGWATSVEFPYSRCRPLRWSPLWDCSAHYC